jgi:hypothetical protein
MSIEANFSRPETRDAISEGDQLSLVSIVRGSAGHGEQKPRLQLASADEAAVPVVKPDAQPPSFAPYTEPMEYLAKIKGGASAASSNYRENMRSLMWSKRM